MQLNYYQSPWETPSPVQGAVSQPMPAPPPDGHGRPRRRKGLIPLTLFAAAILLLCVCLAVIRFSAPASSVWSLPDLFDGGFGDFSPDDSNPNGGFEQYWNTSGTPTTIPRVELEPGRTLLLAQQPGQELSYQAIYEKLIPSVVSVQSYGDWSASQGTGVIASEDGCIITNHHVIAGCSSADVVLYDGRRYSASLVGSDVESDLAVLKIDAEGLTPAEFGNSDLLQVGDSVLAIGNPLGSELFGTMTEGIVSAINRDVNVEGYTMSLIQTTAALNPGNSGGALVNSFGQVVGITNMKMMSDYETIEGLGFAIPTVWAKEVIDVLFSDGAITGRPTIGITCFSLQPGDAAYYGQDAGVYVDEITPGGPADQAGVLPGDVIVSANGEPVNDMDDLTRLRDEAGAGGQLHLTLWRDGELVNVSLTLVEQYELN